MLPAENRKRQEKSQRLNLLYIFDLLICGKKVYGQQMWVFALKSVVHFQKSLFMPPTLHRQMYVFAVDAKTSQDHIRAGVMLERSQWDWTAGAFSHPAIQRL